MLAANSSVRPVILKGAKRLHPVALTALEVLKEARKNEQYETMTGILEIAREFGAEEWDIRLALMKI